ncbi:NAD(P)/FAD-dependent oxidoreductase [Nocardia sp. NPDC050378]|uniref:NAD(P)/FAD-dependent oxidoreductase n=1 Tax=Nocardia sp. NPDC050378 TaxID=3155400 RepID=UPI0033E29DAD
MTELNESYDVVVIGGGAAGLNGALMLVRQRRSVLVIDAGAPRNAPADGVHGLLGREGMPPLELVALGREEVRGYGGQVVTGEVVAVDRVGEPATGTEDSAGSAAREFRVELADGRSVFARRILVTTGLADELPPIAGLRERWGHDVLHCPYCHGWEVRDQRIAVLATGPMAVHQALLFTQLTDDIVFLSHTSPATDEDAEKLAARGVRVVDGEVVEVLADGGKLSGVRLADGTVIDRDALVVGPRFSTRATFLTDLGLTPQPHPSGVGDHIPADPTGRTSVPGVWIAGNATDPMAQVGAAAAAGAMAGAQINAELVTADTAAAVERIRASEAAAVTG